MKMGLLKRNVGIWVVCEKGWKTVAVFGGVRILRTKCSTFVCNSLLRFYFAIQIATSSKTNQGPQGGIENHCDFLRLLMLIGIWMFPKLVGFHPNHPFFHRVFHYFHHPFLGYPYVWKHPYIYMYRHILSLDPKLPFQRVPTSEGGFGPFCLRFFGWKSHGFFCGRIYNHTLGWWIFQPYTHAGGKISEIYLSFSCTDNFEIMFLFADSQDV